MPRTSAVGGPGGCVDGGARRLREDNPRQPADAARRPHTRQGSLRAGCAWLRRSGLRRYRAPSRVRRRRRCPGERRADDRARADDGIDADRDRAEHDRGGADAYTVSEHGTPSAVVEAVVTCYESRQSVPIFFATTSWRSRASASVRARCRRDDVQRRLPPVHDVQQRAHVPRRGTRDRQPAVEDAPKRSVREHAHQLPPRV